MLRVGVAVLTREAASASGWTARSAASRKASPSSRAAKCGRLALRRLRRQHGGRLAVGQTRVQTQLFPHLDERSVDQPLGPQDSPDADRRGRIGHTGDRELLLGQGLAEFLPLDQTHVLHAPRLSCKMSANPPSIAVKWTEGPRFRIANTATSGEGPVAAWALAALRPRRPDAGDDLGHQFVLRSRPSLASGRCGGSRTDRQYQAHLHALRRTAQRRTGTAGRC